MAVAARGRAGNLPLELSSFVGRRHEVAEAKRTLAYWGLREVTDDAVLLVSELVANAVCHARHDLDGQAGGPALVLSLTCAGSTLRIEVRDIDPRPPQPRVPDSLDESGFGFVIVDTMASSWGVYQAEPGKAVWAELALRPTRY